MKLDIYMENTQEACAVDDTLQNLIERVIGKALEYEKFEKNAEVSVLLVDDMQIREINGEFRQLDKPTDVLSFPMLDFSGGRAIDSVGDSYLGTVVLGDIVVSLERAKAQAVEYGHSFEREVGFLVCHSVLHLLGYDHETEEERAVMRQKEEAVLALLGLTR